MNIQIPKSGDNLLNIMRQLGYKPGKNRFGDISFSRPLQSASYPKFHIYVNDTGDNWMLNLHLDQKKPSYEGSSAHAGEHDSAVIEQEGGRIRQILTGL